MPTSSLIPLPGRSASKGTAVSATDDVFQEIKEEKKQKKVRDYTDAITCQLALKHRLMLSEVRDIIREFKQARRTESGGMQQDEFDKVMARIFGVPAINKQVSQSAFRASLAHADMNIDKFLEWYVQNMFTQVNALTADPTMAKGDALAYRVAAKHNIPHYLVDKIKIKFDFYDLDKSGKIDYSEFEAMFCSILKVASPRDLNPDRMQRFWSQVDRNQDGGVDFEEFADWYLKFFNPDTQDDDCDMSGPLQQFYDGFNPTVQRRNHLEASRRLQEVGGP
jgi:Ca2+-binding EF-hand superfamily protein